jgi:ParB/RepB/Spo0J family partition protein
MEPKLAHVKLSDIITSDTNKMFRDDAELSDTALRELIDSVKQLGVIQPILLRPSSNKQFELVAGERRYRASLAAGLATIPANIQELTDEQAFEVQVTENLQRKDVHPLKEAHAYKYLVDKDPKVNTAAELALKFGKTEHYITTRLKLNELVAETRKDFHDGYMTIGHALLIARLQPNDQKELVKSEVRSYRDGKEQIRYYPPVQELEEYINDNIICSLKEAAFNTSDAGLVPKAGACTTCPKRSGANQLFADVKDKDRCFDPNCFLEKRLNYMATQIPVMLEKEPDTVFIETYRGTKTDPAIEKALKDNKARVLKANEYETYNYGDKKVKIKAIYVNGTSVGKKETIYVNGSGATAGLKGGKSDPEKVNAKEAIARINERLERMVELDAEKVYARILDALKQHGSQQESDLKYYTKDEDAMLNFILFDRVRFDLEEADLKKLGLPDDNDFDVDEYNEVLYGALRNMDTAGRMLLMRRYMLRHHFGPMPNTPEAFIIRKVATSYKDIPIAQFEAEQQAIREKREANAAKRIAALKPAEKKKKVKEETERTGKSAMKKSVEKIMKEVDNG